MRELLRMRVVVWGLVTAAGAVVCLSTVLGLAGRLWWVFDLFSHFRVQYLLSLTLLLPIFLLGKRFRTSAVFGLFALVNLAYVLPYYLSASPAAVGSARTLRMASINVNTANRHHDLVRQYIIDNDPEIVLLLEVNDQWARALEEIHPQFPYRKQDPRDDNFGIALFSKIAFLSCEFVYLGEARAPSIAAEFDAGGQRVTLLGTHPLPPISGRYSQLRNDQLEAIAAYLAATQGPRILLGDLNITPWSCHFDSLLSKTGMVDSSLGRGIAPTWPTNIFWMRIPIDFCLVSRDITIKDRVVGPNLGSDHFPLIVDFILPAQ